MGDDEPIRWGSLTRQEFAWWEVILIWIGMIVCAAMIVYCVVRDDLGWGVTFAVLTGVFVYGVVSHLRRHMNRRKT